MRPPIESFADHEQAANQRAVAGRLIGEARPYWRQWLLVLALVLAWDASGWDLAAAHLFGTGSGFAWRDAYFASTVLHSGGRALAWLLLGGQLWAALRPAAASGPSRAERWRWMGVMLCWLGIEHYA